MNELFNYKWPKEKQTQVVQLMENQKEFERFKWMFDGK